MKTLSLIILLISGFGIRFLRFLAWFQQKEYRLDRLWLFFQTTEGKKELQRLIPKKTDFSRTGLKRPKITPRVVLTGSIALLLIILIIALAWTRGWWLVALSLFSVYLLLPGIILLASLPLELVKYWLTRYWLNQASALIRKSQPIIIGITGSYGKTSSKLLLTEVLRQKYSVFSTPKSYNTKLSVSRSICNHYHGEKIVIIEYGAYTTGEIAQLAKWLRPNLAVLTGLTEQHLGLFGSLEQIVQAKAELVKALPAQSQVFVNAQDSGADRIFMYGKSLHQDGESLKRVSYFLPDEEQWQTSIDESGKLVINFADKKVPTNLVGMQYAAQVSLCFLLGESFGVGRELILKVLSEFMPNSNFIRRFELQNGATVIDDGGSSNPVGFKTALALIMPLKFERKILLTAGIVDLGERSKAIHLELAKIAGRCVSEVWYLGEVGEVEFIAEFESRVITDRQIIVQRMRELTSADLLLIEGRMPGWLKLK